jgi:excisionase family DNA binding protein
MIGVFTRGWSVRGAKNTQTGLVLQALREVVTSWDNPHAKGPDPATPEQPMSTATAPPVTPSAVYTPHQVAALANVSVHTVKRLGIKKLIPGRLVVGGQVRFNKATVDAWLSGGCATAQAGK